MVQSNSVLCCFNILHFRTHSITKEIFFNYEKISFAELQNAAARKKEEEEKFPFMQVIGYITQMFL